MKQNRVDFGMLRRARGIPQTHVAKQLGVSRTTLALWEKDSEKIPLKKLRKLCSMYDLEVVVQKSGKYREEVLSGGYH